MKIAFAFDRRHLLRKFAIDATSAAAVAGDLRFVGIRLVEPLHVIGELFIGRLDELGQRSAGEVAVLVVDCLDPCAGDSQQLTPEEIELGLRYFRECCQDGTTIMPFRTKRIPSCWRKL